MPMAFHSSRGDNAHIMKPDPLEPSSGLTKTLAFLFERFPTVPGIEILSKISWMLEDVMLWCRTDCYLCPPRSSSRSRVEFAFVRRC